MFDSMADMMCVSLLHYNYTDRETPRMGLSHSIIAPYGKVSCRDGEVVIVCQQHSEWVRFCEGVLQRPEIEGAITATGKVVDAAAIAAPDDLKGVAVVCVCVLAKGVTPDAALVEMLKNQVGVEVSKPFRPREIYFVDGLPKTRTMKTMRRVVRAAFLGEDLGDLSPVSNPETIAPIAALRKDT